MKSKNKLLWISIVAFTLVIFFCASQLNQASTNIVENNTGTPKKESSVKNNSVLDFSRSRPANEDVKVNVFSSYSDNYNNISDLIKNADVIVKGSVTGVKEERKAGIFFNFDIKKTIKGDYTNSDTITVLTLKDNSQLTEGKSYILALKLDSYYEDTTYHIIGGYQGEFSLEGDKIAAEKPEFQKEIEEIMLKEADSTLSPLDKLSNGLTNRVKELEHTK